MTLAGVPTPPQPNAPRFARLTGVEVLRAGVRPDRHFGEQDLDDMAANFAANGGRVGVGLDVQGAPELAEVAAKLGHEDQELQPLYGLLAGLPGGGTGRPSLGTVTRLYRQGARLYADFDDVPPSVAAWLRWKLYRRVSPEIYDEPPPGCRGKGAMLKAIAFLGAHQPAIKELAGLPDVRAYAEQAAPPARAVTLISTRRERLPGPYPAWRCYGEVVPVDRSQVNVELAGEHRMPADLIAGLTDEQAAAVLAWCQSKDMTPPAPGGTMPPDDANPASPPAPQATMGAMNDDATPAPDAMPPAADPTPDTPPSERDQMVAAILAADPTQSADALAALSDDELRAMLPVPPAAPAMPDATPYGDPPMPMPTDPTARAYAEPLHLPASPEGAAAALQAEIRKAVAAAVKAAVGQATAPALRHYAEQQQTHARQVVREFLDAQRQAGRVSRAEVEGMTESGRHGLYEQGLAAYLAPTVRRYSENGRPKSATAFEDWKALILARPANPRLYAERLADPDTGGTGGVDPARVQRMLAATHTGSAIARERAKAKQTA